MYYLSNNDKNNRMKKVYISGKITGLPIEEAAAKFDNAEATYKDLGFDVINPMKVLPYDPKHTWPDYMLADLAALRTCDAIVLLPCWQDSKGATCEKIFAEGCGLEIMYH